MTLKNEMHSRLAERGLRSIKGKVVHSLDEALEFYDSENRIPPYCFNRKGEVVEPYDFRVKYQTIRDYGWSVTLTFDLLN